MLRPREKKQLFEKRSGMGSGAYLREEHLVLIAARLAGEAELGDVLVA